MVSKQLLNHYGIGIEQVDGVDRPIIDGVLLKELAMDYAPAIVIWMKETPCQFRSEPTGTIRFAKCARKRTVVFECSIHSQCTVQTTGQPDVTHCQHCPDRLP